MIQQSRVLFYLFAVQAQLGHGGVGDVGAVADADVDADVGHHDAGAGQNDGHEAFLLCFAMFSRAAN